MSEHKVRVMVMVGLVRVSEGACVSTRHRVRVMVMVSGRECGGLREQSA